VTFTGTHAGPGDGNGVWRLEWGLGRRGRGGADKTFYAMKMKGRNLFGEMKNGANTSFQKK